MAYDTLYNIDLSGYSEPRELYSSPGSGEVSFGKYERGALESTIEIYDVLIGGTPLTPGVDYILTEKSDYYSTLYGQTFPSSPDNVYSKFQIINVAYQSVDLYIDYDHIGTFSNIRMFNDLATLNLTGIEIKELNKLIEISPTFPWYCLSKPSETWTNSNYPASFIAEMRSKKLTYDEMVTGQTAFTGSWASLVYTLDNTPANVALITALAEDYLAAGTFTDFRLLSDGTNEFEIVGLNALARTITVNAGTPGGTEIEIYLNRVFGSVTSAQHHTQGGLGVYQAGGDKINGMRRLDQMQQITGSFGVPSGMRLNNSQVGAFTAAGATAQGAAAGASSGTTFVNFDSANSPGARAGDTTRIESGTSYRYVFTGGYSV